MDDDADHSQSLYESLKAEEELHAAKGDPAFTPEQLERVIDHLVDMMAQSHYRVLPVAEQERLLKTDGFSPAKHFASKMEKIVSQLFCVDIICLLRYILKLPRATAVGSVL